MVCFQLKHAVILFIFIEINGLIEDDNQFCESGIEGKCKAPRKSQLEDHTKWAKYLIKIKKALADYSPCVQSNCSCHRNVINNDLAPFKKGISRDLLDAAEDKGTKYQIIGGKVFRQKDCMFPARCSGIEHFMLKLAPKLPDLEMVVNTRDWPQISHHFSQPLPVFSFSKTKDYYDIMYPVWAFWEGGPAIKLYPQGMGRWEQHRKNLEKAAQRWPWDSKEPRGFFRGSRTSAERDALVLLSRSHPDLVDASYTKNQAWKSDADTLQAPPAEEVKLEDHCRYRFLFNYRGVAASFRFKHLFLCGSLVFHVGSDWLEFFYPAMKPWVHYVPVPAGASQKVIRELLEFALEEDTEAQGIAERGEKFIHDHLRIADVECYWRTLLKKYAKLLKFKPTRDPKLVEVFKRRI